MDVLVRGHNSIVTSNVKARLFEKGHIFIADEIDTALAEEVKQEIMFLASTTDAPIYLHIDSPGGSVDAGLMIYDVIQSYKERIYTICTGQVASMATVIAASAMKGHRYALQNSELMIHEPLLGNKIGGNCSSIMATSQRLNEVKNKLDNILALHTGKTIDEIAKATAFDNFFSVEEAIEFGLCDKIITMNEIMEAL